MKPTESDLQQIYQQMTSRRATRSAECLDEETLARAVSADISEEERQRVVAHLRRCSDCAREYQAALSMRPFEDVVKSELAGTRPWLRLAATVFIALAVPALVWLIVLQQRSLRTIDRLQRELSVPRQPPVLTPRPTRPQIGIPIVDLDADVTRGTGEVALIQVPPTAESFALIVHLPEEAGHTLPAELIDSRGASLWRGSVSPEGTTVTFGLDRQLAPAGSYALRLNLPSGPVTFRFRVDYR